MITYGFGYGIWGDRAVVEYHDGYFYAYTLPQWWEAM